MRFIFLILLLLGLDYLVFQSIELVIEAYPDSIKTGIIIGYWFIPIIYILWLWNNRNRREKTNNDGNHRLKRSIFYLIYFAKFTLLLFMLFFQIGTGLLILFSQILPNWEFTNNYITFYAKLSLLLSGIPLMVMIYGILRNRHRYKVHRIEVPIKGLPKNLDNLKIVQISDIHSGSFTNKAPLKKGIELINQAKADLVFFTGDLVNSMASEIEPYMDVFGKINARYGIFSIFGNHDYGDYVRWPSQEMKLTNLKRLIHLQKQMGWQLLLNENRLINVKGEKVAIIGVENYSASPRFSKYGDIIRAYKGSESAALKLLLSHDPSHWDAQIVNHFSDIAITFSGHTHGAQFGIEIPGLIKWSPVKYFYKQWAGLYQKGQQFLYVNRGFGYLAYPGRVGILPEITVLTLKQV